MHILCSFQALIQISLLKLKAFSRRTCLFHAVTIKKRQVLAAAFPLKALEHLIKDNYKVADNYGSSHCALSDPLIGSKTFLKQKVF